MCQRAAFRHCGREAIYRSQGAHPSSRPSESSFPPWPSLCWMPWKPRALLIWVPPLRRYPPTCLRSRSGGIGWSWLGNLQTERVCLSKKGTTIWSDFLWSCIESENRWTHHDTHRTNPHNDGPRFKVYLLTIETLILSNIEILHVAMLLLIHIGHLYWTWGVEGSRDPGQSWQSHCGGLLGKEWLKNAERWGLVVCICCRCLFWPFFVCSMYIL